MVCMRAKPRTECSDVPKQERERVLLAIPEDNDWLSDMDCFVWNNIEAFSLKQPDIEFTP